MRSSAQRITAVFQAWAKLGLPGTLTARELLAEVSAGRRKNDPRRAELYAAIDKLGVLPRRANANHAKSFGRWLEKHRNVTAAGLRLHSELDTAPKVWRYSVERIESTAAVSKELERIAADTRAADERERAVLEARLRKSRNPTGTLERALQREANRPKPPPEPVPEPARPALETPEPVAQPSGPTELTVTLRAIKGAPSAYAIHDTARRLGATATVSKNHAGVYSIHITCEQPDTLAAVRAAIVAQFENAIDRIDCGTPPTAPAVDKYAALGVTGAVGLHPSFPLHPDRSPRRDANALRMLAEWKRSVRDV